MSDVWVGIADLPILQSGAEEVTVAVEVRTNGHTFVALRVGPWYARKGYYLKPGWARQLAEALLKAVAVIDGAEPPAFKDRGAGI